MILCEKKLTVNFGIEQSAIEVGETTHTNDKCAQQ